MATTLSKPSMVEPLPILAPSLPRELSVAPIITPPVTARAARQRIGMPYSWPDPQAS